MPLINYGTLRGQILDASPYQQGADHYQILVKDDTYYRIAVDVYSRFAGQVKNYSSTQNMVLATDRMVMFYKDENYQHPIIADFLQLKSGFTAKSNLKSSLCLDYVHSETPLFPIEAMKIVQPKSNASAGENLNSDIDPWIQKAKNNPQATVFAFGSGWNDNAPGSNPDQHIYFNPNPSLGIHNIHMNQGDSGMESKSNGSGQDGALFIYFSDIKQCVAMFFRFQNQSIDTDAQGNPV
ncbi:MAG: DUF2278 family protein [Janthinobacterium lividum]